MGDKLGKMVKIFTTLVLTFFVFNLSAELLRGDLKPLGVAKDKLSIGTDAKILSVTGSKNGISLRKTKIAKPNSSSLSSLRLLTPRDRFALRVLDKNKKEIALLGLGNPFYISAQHMGYEDSKVFGGFVEQEFDIALPLTMDASYLVLLSQGSEGLVKINEIQIK